METPTFTIDTEPEGQRLRGWRGKALVPGAGENRQRMASEIANTTIQLRTFDERTDDQAGATLAA
jgi:hypothetical protein